MSIVHLIRHGRPDVTGVLVGSSDVDLDGSPIAAVELAVDRVYSSPLLRARKTAELLFPALPPQIVPAFAERCLGEWELKSWAEIESEVCDKDWLAVIPPGGEGWTEFVARVKNEWTLLPKGGEFAIVAHVGVNSILHGMLTGCPPVEFRQQYLEVISLAISD